MDVGKAPILDGYEHSQVFSCVGKLYEMEEAVGNVKSGSHSGCK